MVKFETGRWCGSLVETELMPRWFGNATRSLIILYLSKITTMRAMHKQIDHQRSFFLQYMETITANYNQTQSRNQQISRKPSPNGYITAPEIMAQRKLQNREQKNCRSQNTRIAPLNVSYKTDA